MTSIGKYFPMFYDLRGARVLVAGAGKVAERKIAALLAHGATVTVVADKISGPVKKMAERGKICAIRSSFLPGHLDGAAVAFAATSDRGANRAVAKEARRRGIPVNVADVPAECTFILPASIHSGDFTIAVSTGGKHPGAARAIREFLEEHKEEISVRFERGKRRREIRPSKGKVYIVGAGPGDPDLLTVRALGLLRGADAIIHDYLVPGEIISLASPKAAKLCFARRGKTAGHGSKLKQAAIQSAMARLASAGKSVVRLKSGDPFIFGRGGEEAEYLAARGIPFEIIPGITAATGCAASAGIPLTHRDLSSSLTLLAGHESDGKDAIDWKSLPADGTLAVYMGVARAPGIARDLMEKAGFSEDTPFAVVEKGARRGQRVFRGRLADLALIIEAEGIRSPALLFVGKTAACRLAGTEPFNEEQKDELRAKSV